MYPEKIKYTEVQLARLEKLYQENPLPNFEERVKLALKLNATEYKIKMWFKNRRMRTNKLLQLNRKMRYRISLSQQVILEKFLTKFTDPDENQHKKVMAQTGLSKKTISIWFRNQRAKNEMHLASEENSSIKEDIFTDVAICAENSEICDKSNNCFDDNGKSYYSLCPYSSAPEIVPWNARDENVYNISVDCDFLNLDINVQELNIALACEDDPYDIYARINWL